MATDQTVPPQPQPANLTTDQMKLGIARLNRRIADLEAFDPQSVQQRYAPEVKALQASIEESLSSVLGHGTVEYNRYDSAAIFDWGPGTTHFSTGLFGDPGTTRVHDFRPYLAKSKKTAISLLRQAVGRLEEEISYRGESATGPIDTSRRQSSPQNTIVRFLSCTAARKARVKPWRGFLSALVFSRSSYTSRPIKAEP